MFRRSELSRSESKLRSANKLSINRNSLQTDWSRRSSSVEPKARSSGGNKPRSSSDERKSIFKSSDERKSLFPNWNGGRKSSLNVNERKLAKDPRPLTDKGYQKQKTLELIEYLKNTDYKYPLAPGKMAIPSKKDFENMFEHLSSVFEPNYKVKKIEEEAPRILKSLRYRFIPNKSSFLNVFRTNWPHLLGILLYLMDLAMFLNHLDKDMIFENIEAQNPGGFDLFTQHVLVSYFSRNEDEEDKEQETEMFENIVMSRMPFDVEKLRKDHADTKRALEQVQEELTNIANQKNAIAEQAKIISRYETYLTDIKGRKLKKIESVQKLTDCVTEKETELNKLKLVVAEKQATYDAQGFDGKKQLSYFQDQKKQLSQKLHSKKETFKALQNECWDAEMQYAQTRDKCSAVCEEFNELYMKLVDTAHQHKNVASSFHFPDYKMKLGDISSQETKARKLILEDMRKKIIDAHTILKGLSSTQRQELTELRLEKSNLSVKLKVLSSHESRLERDVDSEEKQILDEVKALESQCEEKYEILEELRAERKALEKENLEKKEKIRGMNDTVEKKQKMLEKYLDEQQDLFQYFDSEEEKMKKTIKEGSEKIASQLEKLK